MAEPKSMHVAVTSDVIKTYKAPRIKKEFVFSLQIRSKVETHSVTIKRTHVA